MYSICALEVTWRLGGTGAATSEEALAETKAQRQHTEEARDDFELDLEEDEFMNEDDPLASAAGVCVWSVCVSVCVCPCLPLCL